MKICITIVFIYFSNPVFAQMYKYDSLSRVTEVKYDNGNTTYLQNDPNGNRTQHAFTASSICSGANASFLAEQNNPANTYQWQIDSATGFVNIVNDNIFSGVSTNRVTLKNPPTFWYGYKFRCSINGSAFSNTDTLKFIAVWYGGQDTVWENPVNWGCNKVPDAYTDVVIYGNVLHHPVISSNQAVRTFKGNPEARLVVKTGNTFHIAIPN